MKILDGILGDTPAKLERWYNLTGILAPISAGLLLVLVIQNFFLNRSKSRR